MFSEATANSILPLFILGKISSVFSKIFQLKGISIEIFSVSIFSSQEDTTVVVSSPQEDIKNVINSTTKSFLYIM